MTKRRKRAFLKKIVKKITPRPIHYDKVSCNDTYVRTLCASLSKSLEKNNIIKNMRVGYLERHRKILIEFSIQDLHHFHSGAEELYVFKNEYVFGKSESRIHDSYLRSEYMLVAQDPYHKTKIVNYVNAFVHQRIKGYKAEKRVADIIAKILDERQALPCQFYIASFMKAGKLNDTHYGIDLHITVITPSAHKIVPLQIKSSIHAQREHKQKFPKIPSLVIHQQTDAEIIQLISDILEGYVWGKIRHLS